MSDSQGSEIYVMRSNAQVRSARNSLSECLFQKMKSGILQWRASLASEVYAISFFVSDDEDDASKPTLTLGCNTLSHWRQSASRATDPEEAKWNYAYWLRTKEAFFGDKSDLAVRQSWIDEVVSANRGRGSGSDIALDKEIAREFLDIVVSVARRLHEEGVIDAKFAKAIPIIVHGLEYYDRVALQTEQANPPDTVKEFIDWIRSMSNKKATSGSMNDSKSGGSKAALARLKGFRQKLDDGLKSKKRT